MAALVADQWSAVFAIVAVVFIAIVLCADYA